nr:VENN motif pre-toxin domain-containing protein [Buttiauxella sp. B2]
MFPDTDNRDLSESDKQLISNLATIASGLAGNLTGGDSSSTTAGAQAGKNAINNNLLGGGTEDGQAKAAQEHAKNVMSCSTDPGSDSCRKGLAMQDALMVALPAGLGGGMLAAATPEMAAAAQAAIQGCAGSIVLCLNNVGIQMSEAIVPGGVGAGGAVGIGKTAAEATAAKAEAVAANAAKNSQLPTGTVFDSIKGTQPVYPGSVIPKSFEMTLPNGQKVWVHGNATEHMAEYAASKAVTQTPEAVRLASQEELRSFQAAVNTATKNNMPYGERITVDGWQLEIKPPRSRGELPTIIHARYLGSH